MKRYNSIESAIIISNSNLLLQEYMPKLEKCLEELSESDIWWRENEASNSVGNLVLHLSGNIRQWIISGIGEEKDNRERSKEFSAKLTHSKGELVSILSETVHKAVFVLQSFDLSKLLEVRNFQVYETTCLEAIIHVVEHFSYHLGQIVYITKLRTNKDLHFYNL